MALVGDGRRVRVLVWSALGSGGPHLTGVGKHILRMAGGLATLSGWNVRLLVAADARVGSDTDEGGESRLQLPPVTLPMTRRCAEALWRTINWPPVERFAGLVDWVYCPKELFVPVRRARLAITVHDLYHLEPCFGRRNMRNRLQSRQLRKALAASTVVLTVSEFTKERLVSLAGVAPDKIRIVGNGVEQGYFIANSKAPAECSPFPGQDYLVSVGGLTKKKGGENLLRLAQALAKELPEMLLVIVGPVEPAYDKHLGVAPNVRLIRRGIADRELQNLVRGAAAAIVLSEYEGFGIPVLEAMAAGVPVIASDRGALPEVCADAGIVVDPGRPADIVNHVASLVRNNSLRDALIAKGRVHAGAYTWERCVSRLAAALEECGPAHHA